MKKTALLVVDVQTCMVRDNPYRQALLIDTIKQLLEAFRNSKGTIIYVRHNEDGDPDFALGSPGWQIYSEIAPQEGELIVEKQFNSSFKATFLEAHLKNLGITDIILVGMQTEYCIDATCKSAFEKGFSLTIPEEGHSTFDNDFMAAEQTHAYFSKKIWNKRYARVIPFKKVLEEVMETI